MEKRVSVASRAEAWIETAMERLSHGFDKVASRAEAWIETSPGNGNL